MHNSLDIIIYSTLFEIIWSSCGAFTIWVHITWCTEAVCMQCQDSSNYSLLWAASSWRCVTVSTVPKLFSEVQPLAVEDQNKTWLAMPLQGSCSTAVQLYWQQGISQIQAAEEKKKKLKGGDGHNKGTGSAALSCRHQSCSSPDSYISANDRLCYSVAQMHLDRKTAGPAWKHVESGGTMTPFHRKITQ